MSDDWEEQAVPGCSCGFCVEERGQAEQLLPKPGSIIYVDEPLDVNGFGAIPDDPIKSPPHYLIDWSWPGNKPEVRHIIAWAVKGLIGEVAYQHATVLKYMLRATRKNKYWQDVQKAHEHLGFLLEARGDEK